MTAAKFRARLDRTDAIPAARDAGHRYGGLRLRHRGLCDPRPVGHATGGLLAGRGVRLDTGTAWRPQHRGLGAAPLFLDVPRERSVNE